jgi:hypothetical protein
VITPASAIKALGGVKSGRTGILCPGPGHGKRDVSLSVIFGPEYPEGFGVHSFAGDDFRECRDYVRDKLGLPAWKPNGVKSQAQPVFVAREYVYEDANGEPYHMVQAMSDGSYRQHKFDIDGFVPGTPDMIVPYALPDVLTDETIWLVRGEHHAELIRDGFNQVATTYPSGLDLHTDASFIHHLAGRDVRILDTGGARSAEFCRAFSDALNAPVWRLPDGVKTLREFSRLPDASLDRCAVTTVSDVSSTTGIQPTAYTWTDPTTIPRREWLYGRHLIRKYVSTTISPGGLGKSSMVMVEALAMVSGQPLLNERVHTPEPLRVWYWNGEDPNEESARRIQAAAIEHKLTPDDLADRLFVDSGREMRLKLASMARGEITLDEELFDEITAALKQRRIDVWTIDPFISAHQVSENDNGAIDAVIKRLGIVAERANCAIELVHHVRKGNGQAETTVEDARGASALIGGVRSARVLNVMSKDIAEMAQIDPKARYSYFSVTNGKSNMGPRSDNGLWRKIVSIDLGNAKDLDHSDHVGVVIPYELPSIMSGVHADAANIAQDTARQFDNGRLSPRSPDWFGHIVGPRIGVDTENKEGKFLMRTLIDKWIENGILATRTGHDNAGVKRDFITVPDTAEPYTAASAPDESPF